MPHEKTTQNFFSILYIRNTLSLLIIIFMYNLIICGNIFAESLTYEYTVKENNISKESDEFIYIAYDTIYSYIYDNETLSIPTKDG